MFTCVEMELAMWCSEDDMETLAQLGKVAIMRQYNAAHRYVCDDENVDGCTMQQLVFSQISRDFCIF